MKLRIALLLAVILPLAACGQESVSKAAAAPAAKPAQPMSDPAPVPAGDPRIALAAKIPGAKPEDLRPTPVAGIFEITHGTDISYITADAGYVFSGDMYKVSQTSDFPNLTDMRRRELRLGLLAKVPESQMLIYEPEKTAYTITVFTDVDCPWCRQMHSEIAEYNKLGFRVRYMFYPRSGPNTESWAKADTVWCSADRKAAFTKAKLGKKLDLRKCPASPVAHDYKLGQTLGITGTPGVVLDTGELVLGYLSPTDLLAHIKEEAAKSAKLAAAK